MHVLDLDRIYRNTSGDGTFHDWGDYLYCQDNSDYQGTTIIAVPNDSDIVPWYILDQYILLERLDQISLYISDHNPIDQTPGITGDISIDFPYTPGISVQSGDFDGTGFVTDGTEGYVLGGPNCQTVNGVYDFELDYEILEGDGAAFELSLDWGAEKIGSTDLSASRQKGSITGVVLEEGHALEYHVWCPQGTIMRIKKITVTRTD